MTLEKVRSDASQRGASSSDRSGSARRRKTHEIDARPSDAIALALDHDAPIFVAEDVFQHPEVKMLRAGEELPGLEAVHQRAVAAGRAEPEPAEKEWRSFRSLPRHDNKYIRPRAR